MLSVKPWRTETVFFLVAAQVFFVLSGAVVMSILHKFGLPGFKGDNDFGNILIGTLSFQGVTWVLMVIFFRLNDVSLREGLGFGGKNLLLLLILAFVTMIIVLFFALLLQKWSILFMEKIHWTPQNEEAVALLTNASSVATQIYLGFFAVVLAPVAEEFLFRGLLFPFIKQLGYPKSAWIGVSLLFALIHFDAAIFISLFVLALVLTWLYEITDNLLAPIFAHALFNGGNLVLLVLQSYFPQYLPHWLFSFICI